MRSRPSGMCWRGVLVLRKLLPASQRNTLPFKPRRGNKNARPIAQQTASKEQLHPSHPHWRKKTNKQKKGIVRGFKGYTFSLLSVVMDRGKASFGVGVLPTIENNSVIMWTWHGEDGQLKGYIRDYKTKCGGWGETCYKGSSVGFKICAQLSCLKKTRAGRPCELFKLSVWTAQVLKKALV